MGGPGTGGAAGQCFSGADSDGGAGGAGWVGGSGGGGRRRRSATEVPEEAAVPAPAMSRAPRPGTSISSTSTGAEVIITANVPAAPAITSADNTTFTVGSAGTFTVSTTGYPTPSISDGGATLPSGVTFVDNGDGTATLSGTPAAGTGGSYPFTITASNGQTPDATQSFTLYVDESPAITSADNTTFTAGPPGTFTVTTTGVPTPSLVRRWSDPSKRCDVHRQRRRHCDARRYAGSRDRRQLPVHDHGRQPVGTNTTQSFTLTVDQSPGITSADATTFTTGNGGSPSRLPRRESRTLRSPTVERRFRAV